MREGAFFATGEADVAREAERTYDPAMSASTAAATASRERPVAAYAAGACSVATTPPSTWRSCGFRPTFDRPCMRCTGSFAGRTRSSTARVAPWSPRLAWPRSTPGRARSNAGWPEGRRIAVAALVDAGLRLELPLEGLRGYMRSMRVDCGGVHPRREPSSTATWTGARRPSAE